MVVPIIIPNGLASEWERVGSLPAGDAVDVDDPAGLPETLTGEATKAASNAQAENNCMVWMTNEGVVLPNVRGNLPAEAG